MPTRKQRGDVDPVVRCSCGRRKADATCNVQHSATYRFSHYRCECGVEWTVKEANVDLHDPISSDEVIEVHKRMNAPGDQSLTDLLR